MDINDGLVSWPMSLVAMIAWLAILSYSIRSAHFAAVGGGRIHVYLGAAVTLVFLWSLRAGVEAGLYLHLLGVTSVSLMFGWRLAVVAVSAVLLLVTANGAGGWWSLGLNFLIMGAAPIALTETVLRLCQRYLPLHFFVYVFINAFLCAGLAVVASGLLSTLLLSVDGPYALTHLTEHYLNFYFLMYFPEAVFNGMVMTLLVVYRPEWVATFTDDLYLRRH